MARPAMFWKNRTIKASLADCTTYARVALQNAGMSDIKVTTSTVSGSTDSVHAAIGILKKQAADNPPSGGEPVNNTANQPTYFLVFFAAGQGSKAALDLIVEKYDAIP